MLTFLLLVFSPLITFKTFFITSKTFFITRQDLRLVPRALAGALASGVLNFWPLEHLLGLVWMRWFPGPLGGPGVGGGCNPGAPGITSGDGKDGAPHQPLPGGRGCPPWGRQPLVWVPPHMHSICYSGLSSRPESLILWINCNQNSGWVAATREQPLKKLIEGRVGSSGAETAAGWPFWFSLGRCPLPWWRLLFRQVPKTSFN